MSNQQAPLLPGLLPVSKGEEMNASMQTIRALLATVSDPELPVVSVLDLGIVRDFALEGDELLIWITPTYSGCPAMDVISMQIRLVLLENGFRNIKIIPVLSPAWTTDWITTAGKEKLLAYGIAPPVGKSADMRSLQDTAVQCPQCESWNTKLVSEFSATSCKAFYTCNECLEPFDHFKCH